MPLTEQQLIEKSLEDFRMRREIFLTKLHCSRLNTMPPIKEDCIL